MEDANKAVDETPDATMGARVRGYGLGVRDRGLGVKGRGLGVRG